MSTSPEDTEAIFLTHAWEERLEIIRHLIVHSRQILLILGDEGSGKSTLRGYLARTAPSAWRVVTLDAAPFDDASTLSERLAIGLGMTPAPKERLEVRDQLMREHLRNLQHTGVLPVALIDDAHQLPGDALLLLLRLAASEVDAPLRVVLFCDPRVTRLLESPQLQAYQRAILHTVEMPAYTAEETAAFLVWRYTGAGRDPNQLVEARVRAVHQASKGWPGRILALETGGVAQETQKNNRPISRSHSHRVYFIGAVAVSLLTALAVFVWRVQAPPERSSQPSVQESPQDAAVVAPLDQPPATPEGSATETPTTPAGTLQEKSGPMEANTRAADNQPAKVSPPSLPATTTMIDTTPATRAAKPPAVVTAPKRAAESGHAPKGDAWLRKQSPDRYVVQLFGSHDRNAAQKYAERPDLAGHTAIYTTLRDHQPLYVVVYGLYANRAEAIAAADRLPADVARQKPFPRSVGDVQRLMSAGQ